MKYHFCRKKWEIMHSLLFISHAMGLHRKTYVRAAEDLDASSDAVWSTGQQYGVERNGRSCR